MHTNSTVDEFNAEETYDQDLITHDFLCTFWKVQDTYPLKLLELLHHYGSMYLLVDMAGFWLIVSHFNLPVTSIKP